MKKNKLKLQPVTVQSMWLTPTLLRTLRGGDNTGTEGLPDDEPPPRTDSQTN